MATRFKPIDKDTFLHGSIVTYGAAVKQMKEVWEKRFGEPMPDVTGPPRVRFRSALRHFELATRGEGLRVTNDDVIVPPTENTLSPAKVKSVGRPNIENVPPAVFKEAIWEEATERAAGETADVGLDVFLRGVVTRVRVEMKWERKFNVGDNQHLTRMVQWLREFQEETTFEHGIGLKLMNRSGRGRVALLPTDPLTLMVRLDGEWL